MTRILTILGLLFLGFTNQSATACSCIGESTVESGYKSADIVTSGQVISIETEWLPDSTRIKEMVELGFPADSLDKRFNGYYLRKVLILVDTVYKGSNRSDTLAIYTGMGNGDCGYRFREGQKYIIYADTDSYFGAFFRDQEFPDGQNVYWTNICKRTREHNPKEIKELEKIKNKNGR